MPEVRRFILESGNADAYIGVRINFIPHHSPEFITLDDDGKDKDTIDIADYSFDGLMELMESHGFEKKEML